MKTKIKQDNLRKWCMQGNTLGNQSGELCSNRGFRIELIRVDDETKRFNFDMIVKTYHTYKPTTKYCGRRMDYLIKYKGEIVGAIGLGSPVIAMSPRDKFIGWNEEQRLKNLTKIGSNWRFCLMDKGIGSRVLSVFCKTVKKDFKKEYNENLCIIETLVEPPYKGTCYKANGWKLVGETSGITFEAVANFNTKEEAVEYKERENLKSCVCRSFKNGKTLILRPADGTKKLIFLKPIHKLWKKELLGDIYEKKDKEEENRKRMQQMWQNI